MVTEQFHTILAFAVDVIPVVTAAVPVAVVSTPTDFSWISITIGALGIIVVQLFNMFLTWKTKQTADESNAKAAKAVETVEKVAVAVDGAMAKLLAAKTAEATAVATLEEKKAEDGRKAAAALAVKDAVIAAPVSAPTAVAETIIKVDDAPNAILLEAARVAKQVLKDAAELAATVLVNEKNVADQKDKIKP